MVELVVKNKLVQSRHNKGFSTRDILMTNIGLTLVQDLTSIENNSGRFWNSRSKELVSKLFVPHQIVSREQGSRSLNISSNYQEVQSPLLMSRELRPRSSTLINLSVSLPPSSTPIMEKEVREEEILISRKMEIRPVREYRWKHLIDISRWSYNLAIEKFNSERDDKSKGVIVKEVIEFIRTKIDTTGIYEVIAESVARADITYRRLLRDSRRDGRYRKMSFKSRKKPKQTFYARRTGKQGPFPSYLKDTREYSFTFRDRKEALKYFKKEFNRKPNEQEINAFYLKGNEYLTPSGNKDKRTATITYENGRWFISIYKKRMIVSDNQATKELVSLDPGTKPFLTSYDGEIAIKIGLELHSQLLKIDKKIDKLVSKRKLSLSSIAKCFDTKCQRYQDIERYWKRRIEKLRFRRFNLLNHFQWKVASYLTSSYKVILLPKLETQRIVKDTKRKALNRNIVSMNHYQFLLKLKYLSKVKGNILIHPDESHTSKTLCLNGYYNKSLGSSKTYNYDNIKIDRDVNGAINILLKTFQNSPMVWHTNHNGRDSSGGLPSSGVLKNVKSHRKC